MNYSTGDLDNALVQISDENINVRKIGVKFFQKASCLELGTKNTVPIREWIIVPKNRDELLRIISTETDEAFLCKYIYTLQMFCQRYIDNAKNVKNSEEFIKNPLCLEFKLKAFHMAEEFMNSPSAKIQVTAAYFLISYGNSLAWDAIIMAISKKTNSNILTKASDCVSVVYYYLIGNGKDKDMVDITGRTINKSLLISLEQARKLKAMLSAVYEKNSKSASKAGLTRVVIEIEEIILQLENSSKNYES